uniref:Addiction module antidote protein n=1 Tax=uncultured Elusimicrobia bacterium TaxID=699876 RepID=A0A650ELY4_9BACT|nr:hypothetical protein Elusimicrob1349_1130 [uncultured Elusimicrobia bacterium]
MTKKPKISFLTLEEVDREFFENKPENIRSFLNVAIEEYMADGDKAAFMDALAVVAKYAGISKVAGKSGLTRQGIYKAVRPGARPAFTTVLDILHGAGFSLKVVKG